MLIFFWLNPGGETTTDTTTTNRLKRGRRMYQPYQFTPDGRTLDEMMFGKARKAPVFKINWPKGKR